MNWLKSLRGGSASLGLSGTHLSRRVTFVHPLIIELPNIGFVNLCGDHAREMLAEDRTALAPLFQSTVVSENENPPLCDVLMLYAHIYDNGVIAGSSDSLREIIRKSGAAVLIVAFENSGPTKVGLTLAGRSAVSTVPTAPMQALAMELS